MLADAKSDIGLVRQLNEDSYVFMPPHLFAVADGMGGHVAGEIASKLAAKVVQEYVLQHLGAVETMAVLAQAIAEANTAVYQMAQAENEYAGMGTTVTLVYAEDDLIYWGHVGDSRLYLFRDNELRQLTNDHSLVWELMQSGTITREEAINHPQRNILTRAVGSCEQVKIDTGSMQIYPGDILLLCTDGLTNMVSEAEICEIVGSAPTAAQTVDKLIEQARAAGGYDNITAVIAKCEAE